MRRTDDERGREHGGEPHHEVARESALEGEVGGERRQRIERDVADVDVLEGILHREAEEPRELHQRGGAEQERVRAVCAHAAFGVFLRQAHEAERRLRVSLDRRADGEVRDRHELRLQDRLRVLVRHGEPHWQPR
mgnify:CR=1 FL=1